MKTTDINVMKIATSVFLSGFSFKKIALKIADSIGAIATMISVFATFVFCIDNIKVILVAVKVIA